MNRHHTGSGRRAVIPQDWGTNHAPVANGTMTALIALREPGGTKGSFNTVTGEYPITPHTPYATDVPCRVQALTTEARHVTAADDQATVSNYLVTLPIGQDGIKVGHVGTVTGSGDPLLDGHLLRVDDIARGTQRFERDMFCTLTD